MSSTNKKNIIESELYPTPPELAKAFIDLVDWKRLINDNLALGEPTTFIEPCRGTGSIYDQIPLEYKCYAEIKEGLDYLSPEHVPENHLFSATITNPPFSLTEDFIKKSLRMASPWGFVAYLQKVNFLGSKKRNDFWREVKLPDKLIIATPRPSFAKSGSDSCEYAWFCWDPNGYINDGPITANKGGLSILPWNKPDKRKLAKQRKADGKENKEEA